MPRSNEEFLAEVKLRAALLTQKRQIMCGKVTAFSFGIVATFLTIFSFWVTGGLPPMAAMNAGGTAENAVIGAYMLTGVLCFAFGAAVTLFSVKLSRKAGEK